MVHAFDNGPESDDEGADFDPAYAWAGGVNPHGDLYDGKAYDQTEIDLAQQALADAFGEFCDGQEAFDRPTAAAVDYFTSSFYSALHSGLGKLATIGTMVRANREANTAFVLLYSHQQFGKDVEFYLPTAVARPLNENSVAAGVVRNGNTFGQIKMDGLERITTPNTRSGIGYIVQMNLVGEETVFPNVFGAGDVSRLALSHVVDAAESVQALKAQKRVNAVVELGASSVLALALAQILEKESVLLGITGIELERGAGLMHVGVMIPELSPSQGTVVDTLPDSELLTTANFSPLLIDQREVSFRFKITEQHRDVIYPDLIDARGRLFSKKI